MAVPPPRVIVVYFQLPGEDNEHLEIFRKAGCLVHGCKLPNVPSPSFIDRMIKRKSPWIPNIQPAYDFVVGNYRGEDEVVILDTLLDRMYNSDLVGQKTRHTAIRQLAAALEKAFLHKPGNGSTGERIPIKCVFLQFTYEGQIEWPEVDQLFSDFPSPVENFLCFNDCISGGYSAYAMQRGSYRQVKRKESWHSPTGGLSTLSWFMLQSSHFISHDPTHLVNLTFSVESLSKIIYSNYTKRRGGLPSDDAIPTGGQFVRIAYINWDAPFSVSCKNLVWLSQSFAEGEYDDVCGAPLYGPERL
ncbi:hypothetical protein BDV93DRAFT_611910 [Ceratobasidium sp. AG-I]|nr:hypothetical protein BDV93DRAFT_611910 [Ceratobasidium sp. AG-I]